MRVLGSQTEPDQTSATDESILELILANWAPFAAVCGVGFLLIAYWFGLRISASYYTVENVTTSREDTVVTVIVSNWIPKELSLQYLRILDPVSKASRGRDVVIAHDWVRVEGAEASPSWSPTKIPHWGRINVEFGLAHDVGKSPVGPQARVEGRLGVTRQRRARITETSLQ